MGASASAGVKAGEATVEAAVEATVEAAVEAGEVAQTGQSRAADSLQSGTKTLKNSGPHADDHDVSKAAKEAASTADGVSAAAGSAVAGAAASATASVALAVAGGSDAVAGAGGDAVHAVSAGAQRLIDSVPADARREVAQLVSKLGSVVTSEQFSNASEGLAQGVSGLAVFAAVGAAVCEATQCAPDVAEALALGLAAIGAHLGPIGIAAGLLGTIVYTFQLSRDHDKNTRTVGIWAASVKDWLLLIAERVDRSAAESTLGLFDALKTEMLGLFNHVEKHGKRWRITKMLSTVSFQRDFERAKSSVLELKNALRDFLDQESQDAQEAKLAEVAALQVDVSDKLKTMDDQLGAIREMLTAQAAEKAAADGVPARVEAEEEAIYANMQRATGTTGDVKFHEFCSALELFFLQDQPLDKKVRRGLKIAIDRDNTKFVTKINWIRFYRQWKDSSMTMQDYAVKLGDAAPPTLFAAASASAYSGAARGYSGAAGAASSLRSFAGDKISRKPPAAQRAIAEQSAEHKL
ncbi:hypothetical protein M885DRAFT_505030 [Pelagophyceae sp. CCMP2097]|nr:hypothetical protein M885DRAFT_505030 [Pelagophyceae sp. CCMP2097]